jgi:hypothetical protein
MIRFFSVTCTAVVIILICVCGSAPDNTDSRPRVIDELHNEVRFTNADYEQHVESLKKKVPQGFTIIIQKPFIVIGDESPDNVKLRAEKTIKWTVDMLKQDYFEKDPDDIIDIWLFKDEESYYKYAKEVFGDEPTTPFGYYSETEKALVMNISTGGGTLVHEIVHPFVRANFPECPVWFNEGLASLYEQCGEKNGHIYGYTNWRLKGLQTAIKQGCYYLQEKGLLVKFFHGFYANRKEDPTGYKTIKKILGEEDTEVFKNKWEEFVMKLTFP